MDIDNLRRQRFRILNFPHRGYRLWKTPKHHKQVCLSSEEFVKLIPFLAASINITSEDEEVQPVEKQICAVAHRVMDRIDILETCSNTTSPFRTGNPTLVSMVSCKTDERTTARFETMRKQACALL